VKVSAFALHENERKKRSDHSERGMKCVCVCVNEKEQEKWKAKELINIRTITTTRKVNGFECRS